MAEKIAGPAENRESVIDVRIPGPVDLTLPPEAEDPPPAPKTSQDSGGAWGIWIRDRLPKDPWRLPSLFVDFKKKGNPRPGEGMIRVAFPMELLGGALELPRALWNLGADLSQWNASFRGRLLETAGAEVLMLVDSYLTHEKGHFYDRTTAYFEQPNLPDLMSVAGGFESTQDASHQMMRTPYRGLLSDLSRVTYQMDLPFYRLVSEWVIRNYFSMVDKGDSAAYLKMRRQINGGTDESAAVSLLALWLALDPETLRSLWRLREYFRSGKVSKVPFMEGYWAAAFNGYLAPAGPLFEASAYYYLNSPHSFPSFFKGTVWLSPAQTEGKRTGGIGIEADRFSLPRLDVFGVSLALGFGMSLWTQPENIADFKFPPVLFQGNVNLYAQARGFEISGGIFCKDAGYFPNAPIEQGCHLCWGLSLNPSLFFSQF